MSRLLTMSVALIVTVAAVSVADDIPTTPEALSRYNEAIGKARGLHAQATKASEKKDYDLAISYLSKAIELTPKEDEQLYYARADAYRAINEHGKADEDVKAIIGIYNKVEADFSEQIRLSPNDHYAYFRRSIIYYSKACLQTGVWVDLAQNTAKAMPTTARIYCEMSVADMTVAIRLKPNHADYYLQRASYYYALGNKVESERDSAAFEELRKDK